MNIKNNLSFIKNSLSFSDFVTQKQKIRNMMLASVISFAFLLCIQFLQFVTDCREIRTDVLRLHVIANSDADIDQNVKLKVRDAVLAKGAKIFDGSVNVENAREKLIPKLSELENEANSVLKENGFEYCAKVNLKNEYFPVREYENFTLPSGRYMSLTVTLGGGEGRNWWCVMFPPLCLPAAEDKQSVYDAVFSQEEASIIENKSKYKIKFKILEWTDEIVEKLRSK